MAVLWFLPNDQLDDMPLEVVKKSLHMAQWLIGICNVLLKLFNHINSGS